MPYRYPPEFRHRVLDLLAAGRSVASLSEDLGVSGAARVLSRYLGGRSGGPVFLTHRRPRIAPALADLCTETGRARLSYETAAKLFKHATGTRWTLHQLRHSSLTHLVESGINTEVLMAKSRHKDRRSLDIYARPGSKAVAQATATFDRARTRR